MSLITAATGADALGTDHSSLPQGWQLVCATLGENASPNWGGGLTSSLRLTTSCRAFRGSHQQQLLTFSAITINNRERRKWQVAQKSQWFALSTHVGHLRNLQSIWANFESQIPLLVGRRLELEKCYLVTRSETLGLPTGWGTELRGSEQILSVVLLTCHLIITNLLCL